LPQRKLSRESTPDVKRARDPWDLVTSDISVVFSHSQHSHHDDSADAVQSCNYLPTKISRFTGPLYLCRLSIPPLVVNDDDILSSMNDESDDEVPVRWMRPLMTHLSLVAYVLIITMTTNTNTNTKERLSKGRKDDTSTISSPLQQSL
jgi:hypothetical protein